MPIVHVAMMQKNEGPILARWIGHYSSLFGYNSLTIYDNRSTDKHTQHLLRHAQNLGATVHYGINDFNIKNELIRLQFLATDARANKADFYLPVDCDEYLAVMSDFNVSCHRDDILREMLRHRYAEQSLQIPGSLYNDPGCKNAYVMEHSFFKSFFRSGAIGTLDTGFHFGTSGLTDGVEQTRLIYLHHHNKELESAKETARAKLVKTQADAPNGPQVAYLRWLIACTPEVYTNRYHHRVRVLLNTDTLPTLLFPNGEAVMWDGHAYLEHYSDVRHSYPLGALHHFMSHGADEKRFPTPVAMQVDVA